MDSLETTTLFLGVLKRRLPRILRSRIRSERCADDKWLTLFIRWKFTPRKLHVLLQLPTLSKELYPFSCVSLTLFASPRAALLPYPECLIGFYVFSLDPKVSQTFECLCENDAIVSIDSRRRVEHLSKVSYFALLSEGCRRNRTLLHGYNDRRDSKRYSLSIQHSLRLPSEPAGRPASRSLLEMNPVTSETHQHDSASIFCQSPEGSASRAKDGLRYSPQ